MLYCVAQIARRVAVVHWCVLRTRDFDRLAFGQYLHQQPLLHQLRGFGASWLCGSAAPQLRGSAAPRLRCFPAPWHRGSMRGFVASRLRSSAASQLRFQQRGRHLARNISKAEPYTESKSNPSGIQATFTESSICGSGPVLGSGGRLGVKAFGPHPHGFAEPLA